MHRSTCGASCALLFALSFILDLCVSHGREHDIRRHRFSVNVDEVEKALFAHDDDPFADEDRWAGLQDDEREAWSASNEVVRLSEGMRELLKKTDTIRQEGIKVHVDVQLIVSEKYLSGNRTEQISRYANAMRAGRIGTSLTFTVSVAPQTVYNRISMYNASQNPVDFIGILEQTAATVGSVNVLYVIVNHKDEPVNEYAATIPFVGSRRVSWVMYNIEKGHQLNIASVLAAAERAAERVYAPVPLYFPIPLIRRLRVEVAAYTPGHEHRALWLQNFTWNEFETAVRSVAVHGQTVGFFSAQANSECQKCGRAFRDIEKYALDFNTKAAISLNNDVPPNASWAYGQAAISSKRRIPKDSFRLYVVDTIKLRRSEWIQRLERRMLSSFPGTGIIIFRSSHEEEAAQLESVLIKAIMSGVYGIMEPDLYIHQNLGRHISRRTRCPSSVFFDVVVRYLVRSIVESNLAELEEIAQGILYFDIDPTKSLGNREYSYFEQRVNLVLLKLQRAQRVLGELNDGAAALYLASSTTHDIKAIRASFGLNPEDKSFERFRDPTLRCHFSRLRREALRASQILESSYPELTPVLVALASFLTAMAVTNMLLGWYSSRKMRGKRA